MRCAQPACPCGGVDASIQRIGKELVLFRCAHAPLRILKQVVPIKLAPGVNVASMALRHTGAIRVFLIFVGRECLL
jgi:hypothetical protein